MTKEGILAKPVLEKEVTPNVQQPLEKGGDSEIFNELKGAEVIMTPEEEKIRVEDITDTVSTEADEWSKYAKEETGGSIPEEGLFDWLLKSKVGNTAKALMLSTALAGAMSFMPASSAEAGDRRYGRNQRQAEENYRYRQYDRYLNWKIEMIGFNIEQRARAEVMQNYMALQQCGRELQMTAYKINNVERAYSMRIMLAERNGQLDKIKDLEKKMEEDIAPLVEHIQLLEVQYEQLEKQLRRAERKSAITSIATRIGIGILRGDR